MLPPGDFPQPPIVLPSPHFFGTCVVVTRTPPDIATADVRHRADCRRQLGLGEAPPGALGNVGESSSLEFTVNDSRESLLTQFARGTAALGCAARTNSTHVAWAGVPMPPKPPRKCTLSHSPGIARNPELRPERRAALFL